MHAEKTRMTDALTAVFPSSPSWRWPVSHHLSQTVIRPLRASWKDKSKPEGNVRIEVSMPLRKGVQSGMGGD